MPSRLTAALFGAGLFALAAGPLPAQEKKDPPPAPKKDKPKTLPKISVADPAKAKEDPDFAVQGEYEGEVTAGDATIKIGIQIVAQGEGKFVAKGYHGGLPGAGWDGEEPRTGTAYREAGKVVFKNRNNDPSGELVDGTLVLKGPANGTLKKVDRASPTLGAKPPEGAVVLFAREGDEKAHWNGGKLIELSDGKFLGVGEKTKQTFGAFTAHVEFRLPWMPNSRGQGRGNSGAYLQDRYEVQVLDSFGLDGKDNECGGIYTQHKPLVNICLPPMVWQTYDIDFTPAAFDAAGKKTAPARVTVKHNGVVIHDNAELKGPTGGGQPEKPTPGPIQFQDHNNPVVFRNVWVVEKK